MKKERTCPFKNEKPVPYSKRIIAFVVDALILIVLSIGLSFACCGVASTFSWYKEASITLNQEMNICYSYVEDSKLYTFTGEGGNHYNEYVDQNTELENWCYRHIIRSYNIDKTLFEQQGITKLDIDSSITEASYENDKIAYFYVSFVEKRNDELKIVDLNGKTTKEYYYESFKKNAQKDNDGNEIWIYDDSLSLPILKPTQAFNLYCYYKYNKSNDLTLDAYNKVSPSYIDMFNEETKLLSESQGYVYHYDIYNENYSVVSKAMNVSVVIAWIITFLLGYVLPQFIFKRYHQTFGKKIIKNAFVSTDGGYMRAWQIVLRDILKLLSLSCTTIISNFIVFGGGGAWSFPLFYIGSLGISMQIINFAFLIILFLSFVVSIFPYKKQCICDLCTKTYEIDVQIIENKVKAAIEKTLDTYEANL